MAEQLTDTERPLDVRELAERLGMHVNSAKRIDPKLLPYFTVGSRGDRRYQAADVRAYIASRTVRSR